MIGFGRHKGVRSIFQLAVPLFYSPGLRFDSLLEKYRAALHPSDWGLSIYSLWMTTHGLYHIMICRHSTEAWSTWLQKKSTPSAHILAKAGNTRANQLTTEELARFPEENPNPVMRADSNGTLIYANRAGAALLKLLGWQADETLPTVLRERIIEAAVVDRVEFDLETANRVYSAAIIPIGTHHNFNLYFLDITARKQAEEALRENEARFKAIASSTPDHILVQDRDLRYTFVVNPHLD